MIAFQVFLLVLMSLTSANALETTARGTSPHLVFPKVGESVVLPTQVQESKVPQVQGVLPSLQSQPVRRYAVHEDAVPAAYHHHLVDPTAYQHHDTGIYHHWNNGDENRHYPYDPPKYAYKYSVHDHHTGDSKQAWEHRDGDVTHGGYTVLDPDGYLRIVEYTVTKEGGFQAKVRRVPISNGA